MLKEASSISRRNDNVDKQPSRSLLLHSNTGPLLTMHDPCIPETLFHADDRIISSISLNQGDMSIRKQTHHRHPVPLLLLSSLSFSHILPLSFSRFHYVSHSLSQSPFSLSPTLISPPLPSHPLSVFQSSGEVTD